MNHNQQYTLKASVFCASSSKVSEHYFTTAKKCGEILVKNQYKVYYGGGSVGLMGALADSVLKNKGELIGIIPEFMVEMKWGNKNVTELVVVSDMFERKKLLIINADVIIVLPGGSGTIDELFEAITAKQLGQITAPVIIVNEQGYYDHLLEHLDRVIEEGFMSDFHRKMWCVIDTPEKIPEAIKNAPDWYSSAINGAQL